MFEKNMKFPILLDIYGSLLSERKLELLDYYYNEDYSLAEISEITGISRQGVRDSIKKSEEKLLSIDEKLRLREKNEIIARAVSQLRDLCVITDGETKASLGEIADTLSSLTPETKSDYEDNDATEK